MKYNQNLFKIVSSFLLITVTAWTLTGCAPFDTIMGSSKVSQEEVKEEPSQPAMVIVEEPIEEPEPEEEPVAVEEPEPEPEPEPEGFHGYVLSEEEENDPRVKCMETAVEGEVTLAFAGDINFDEGYSNMSNYRNIGKGIRGVMSSNLMDVMTGADIFMINNEFPYSTGGAPLANKQFTFRAKPEYVNSMLDMGADIVTLANNHAYDYGEEALMDTFDTLENAELPYVGAGRNIEEAKKPFYFIAGGTKIAYVSATQIERTPSPDTKEATADHAGVLRTLDPTTFLSVIEEAKENADFVVVYVHWGTENTYDVEGSQKDLAAKYEEAGADLIIGDHSHNLQGIQYINDTPVIYSLGNFWFNSKDLDTGVFEATVTPEGLKSIRFVPCRQQNCKTTMYDYGSDEANRILGVMVSLSFDVSINAEGYITNGSNSADCVPASEPRPLKKAAYQLTPEEQAALLLQQQLENGGGDAGGEAAVQQ